ncbi:alpha/beta hydrolase [Ramlibacter albus]|uniref:Alpha/beta hydrolase n=1 Tax=Ramlibacter albus TaxID=2079448 RepID=A0A923MCF6_9BURK|nr:alpha/beta hydrolase [Ramlibacter albus]MBC5766839.1 alpha/beta hydrolase [Ramlibacter albus]
MLRSFSIALLSVLGVAALLYAAVLALLWFGQERLLFYPQPLAADARIVADPDVREHFVEVPGARVSVLQLKLPNPKGVVFFLHGNGGNLAGWFTNTEFYRRANFDLVMMDYRGYGKSTGRIEGEAQLRGDAMAVWNRFAGEYEGRRLVVYGRSLGTALAADLSAELAAQGRVPDLTVLVSPYTSMAALADEHYPWVPRFVLRYGLDTRHYLEGVRGPVLLVHGDRDELINAHHSERLAKALPRAKLVVVKGAGHNDLHQFEPYREELARALRAL